jgi:hypothetical protein
MAKFQYTPGSWVKIAYHKIIYTGCTIAYAATIDRKRLYTSDPKYSLTIIPISATFEMKWHFAGHILDRCPLSIKYEHLTINDAIDYQSFYSLN